MRTIRSARILRPLRYLSLKWRELSRSVAHDEIVRQVNEDGSLGVSYLFMTVMASGIATIGLLVNSPAVIIGAMLISPLMAPIVRLGLSIATLEHLRVRNAAFVLACGMAVALLTAFAIVAWSPIQEVTSEIASRTRPSLFDLAVAVLSGLAGGYAMVRGRGGAIVGVAIATALMPPMAVVGFGLASGQWHITRGAGLLFITNLVAIALSVTAVATWYGFSRRRTRHALVWQTLLAFLLVLPLGYPLLKSLRDISRETESARGVRAAVAQVLGAQESRVINLQVHLDHTGRQIVELTLAARHYTQADDRQLRHAIGKLLGGDVDLRLSPIVVANPERASLVDAAIKGVERLSSVPRTVAPTAEELLVSGFPFELAAHDLDASQRSLTLVLAAGAPALATCRDMENRLRKRLPGWKVSIVPPPQGLPPVHFGEGQVDLDESATQTIDLIDWALRSWGAGSVRVYGHASSEGRGNSRIALQRAQSVAASLSAQGWQATALALVPDSSQRQAEARQGRESFRIAEVVLDPREVAPLSQ